MGTPLGAHVNEYCATEEGICDITVVNSPKQQQHSIALNMFQNCHKDWEIAVTYRTELTEL